MEKLFIGRNYVTGEIIETVSFRHLYRVMRANARALMSDGDAVSYKLLRADRTLIASVSGCHGGLVMHLPERGYYFTN